MHEGTIFDGLAYLRFPEVKLCLNMCRCAEAMSSSSADEDERKGKERIRVDEFGQSKVSTCGNTIAKVPSDT